jgi:outer membrane protein
VAGALCVGAASGCAGLRAAAEPVPPAPHEVWVAPAELVPPAAPLAAAPAADTASPEELAAAAASLLGQPLGLPTAIDLALRHNDRTRATWLAARALAAEVGSQQAQWYPDLTLNGVTQRQRGTVGGGAIEFQQTTLTPALDLTWLLLDFGGRAADVAEARQNLVAANYVHNQLIQDVVLDVATAYYSYVSSRALADAARSDLEGAEANLDAADRRHQAGLATIADVLQARTAVSQARLSLQQVEGDMQVIRGGLATAMGLPANLPVDAAALDQDIAVGPIGATIDTALQRALAERPELNAARARVVAAQARIRRERSEGLPTVSLRGNNNRIYYEDVDRDPADNYAALLEIRVPLFSGFEHRYDVEQATRRAESAQAQLEELESRVGLQVWTSYYDLQTAAGRFATTADLLASAEESARVAAGRYQAGVGSILDLLAAQSALAEARAQRILAGADWFLSLARLAHDTGALLPGQALPSPTTLSPTILDPAATDEADTDG